MLDGGLRRGASGGTGEIGFLPVPGTDGLPSATDCEGGFHSLAGSAAITCATGRHRSTAWRHGPAPARPVGPAELVRQAVDAVRTTATEPSAGRRPAVCGARTARRSGGASARRGPGRRRPGRGERGRAARRRARRRRGVRRRRFLDALADRLALGAASVVAVLDPGCVVLGGEVGQAGGDESGRSGWHGGCA